MPEYHHFQGNPEDKEATISHIKNRGELLGPIEGELGKESTLFWTRAINGDQNITVRRLIDAVKEVLHTPEKQLNRLIESYLEQRCHFLPETVYRRLVDSNGSSGITIPRSDHFFIKIPDSILTEDDTQKKIKIIDTVVHELIHCISYRHIQLNNERMKVLKSGYTYDNYGEFFDEVAVCLLSNQVIREGKIVIKDKLGINCALSNTYETPYYRNYFRIFNEVLTKIEADSKDDVVTNLLQGMLSGQPPLLICEQIDILYGAGSAELLTVIGLGNKKGFNEESIESYFLAKDENIRRGIMIRARNAGLVTGKTYKAMFGLSETNERPT